MDTMNAIDTNAKANATQPGNPPAPCQTQTPAPDALRFFSIQLNNLWGGMNATERAALQHIVNRAERRIDREAVTPPPASMANPCGLTAGDFEELRTALHVCAALLRAGANGEDCELEAIITAALRYAEQAEAIAEEAV